MADRNGKVAVDENATKVTTLLRTQDERALVSEDANLDESALAALGYKQEFKRDFSIWSSFGVSFSVLGLLPSIASTLYYNLGYAGTASAVWGWLIAAVIIQATALSIAELCSSMPTVGGLVRNSPLVSFLC